MSKWEEFMAHEPTKLYYEKLNEIIWEHVRCKQLFECLEIGFDVGISARAFLSYPNITLTSVDPGEVDIGMKEMELMNVGDQWKFHPIFSDVFFKTCIWTYDIIYIDGDHSYQQTKKDFDNAWKFLKPGGLLIGHDFLHQKNFMNDADYGITKAVSEFIKEQNVNATIYPPNPGLIVIKK